MYLVICDVEEFDVLYLDSDSGFLDYLDLVFLVNSGSDILEARLLDHSKTLPSTAALGSIDFPRLNTGECEAEGWESRVY